MLRAPIIISRIKNVKAGYTQTDKRGSKFGMLGFVYRTRFKILTVDSNLKMEFSLLKFNYGMRFDRFFSKMRGYRLLKSQ